MAAGFADDIPAADLIANLRTSIGPSDFDNAARILAAREASAAADLRRLNSDKIDAEYRCRSLDTERSFLLARVAELEDKIKKGGGDDPGGLTVKISDLERALKDERDRYALLEAEHSELKLAGFASFDEPVNYKRSADRLQEQLHRVSEDLEVCQAREAKAQERIDRLLADLALKERAVKFVELRTEIQDLRCGKRRAAAEADEWKIKFSKVEAKALTFMDENFALKAKLAAVEKEKGVLKEKLEAVENRMLKVKGEAVERDKLEVLTLKAKLEAAEGDKAENLVLKAKLEAAEKDNENLTLKARLKAMENVNNEIAALKAKLGAVEKENNEMLSCWFSSDSCKSKHDKQTPMNLESSSEKKGARTRTVFDISDNQGGEEMDGESRGFAGEVGPEKANSGWRCADVSDDEDSFCEKNYTQGLSKEKKTAPAVPSSGSSEDDADGEDDHIPIGKLKTKWLSEVNSNSTTDSRKRFCPLRQCEGKDAPPAPRLLRPAAIYDVRGG